MTKELIVKYLHDELSVEERAKLAQWLGEREENRRFFKAFVTHWRLSDQTVEATKQKLWLQINTALQLPGQPVVSENQPHNPPRYQVKQSRTGLVWLSVAASVVLLAAVGMGLWWVNQPQKVASRQNLFAEAVKEPMVTRETRRGEKLTVGLPDGTTVKLNAASTLSYDKVHYAENRKVSLHGEAFFEVVKDKNRPFKVILDSAEITVLGTSFNVRTYPDQGRAEVAVKSGTVLVNTFNNKLQKREQTLLEKGEKVSYDRSTTLVKKEPIADEHKADEFAWVQDYLAFDNLNVTDALAQVSKWYDVDFEGVDKLSSKHPFTAKFKNPPLKDVLQSLAFAYDFAYEMKGDYIIIKPKTVAP